MRLLLSLLLFLPAMASLANAGPEAKTKDASVAPIQPSQIQLSQIQPSQIQIVASIRPLALIAQDVAGDLAEVEVLVPSAASHHDYAMRMSDRRRLEAADLAVWMGPSMERFLDRPLRSLEARRVLALGDESGPESEQQHHHDHSHEQDLHHWLDPRLASQMAQAIGDRLQELMPQHESTLRRQSAAVRQAYEALHQRIDQIFDPVRARGFVVEHRGYDLLVEAYGLNQLAWISEHPEQSTSVRHLFQLEQRLSQLPPVEKARCLFNERAHNSAGVANLAAQLGLRLRSLDILGDEADTYESLMLNLARDMANCLSSS